LLSKTKQLFYFLEAEEFYEASSFLRAGTSSRYPHRRSGPPHKRSSAQQTDKLQEALAQNNALAAEVARHRQLAFCAKV
jgi:hypothetical protein